MLGISCEANDGAPGVRVDELNAEGLAAKGGQLRAGDILLSIDGSRVDDPEDAATRLRATDGEVRITSVILACIMLLVTHGSLASRRPAASLFQAYPKPSPGHVLGLALALA